MPHQYAKFAFTESVREVQEAQGSRKSYASMDVGEDYNFLLSEVEREFISNRDSFYMASVSETDWPYVQHRGGPQGFLKVINENTIGFADYKGNRQYISAGNFKKNNRVSLFLMDYANKRRLKVMGYVSQVDEQDWETLASLEDEHYKARVERGFIIKIVAFDWNCPQHITPRYTEKDLSALLTPLQNQVKELNAQVNNHKPSTALGNGELPLIISGVRQLTPEIRAYELRDVEGKSLPEISAGSHIQVPIELSNNKTLWKTYSISSNPNRTDCYEIAVKKDDNGSGGSIAIHDSYKLGTILHCHCPNNFFSLSPIEPKQHLVLIAGGIGITPIKSMVLALINKAKNIPFTFEVHYAGRSIEHMAYVDRLTRQLDNKLHIYQSNKGSKLSIEHLLKISTTSNNKVSKNNTHFYLCGPESMVEELKQSAKSLGINESNVHYERFTSPKELSPPCELYLSKSNKHLSVSSQETLLDAVLTANVNIPYSCISGECKSCVVKALPPFDINHNDNCLTEKERAEGNLCLCVSRPKNKKLTLDL